MALLDRRRRYKRTQSVPVESYLTFTALESGTFSLTIPKNLNTDYLTSVSYSTDNGATWVTTNNDTTAIITITTPTIPVGGKVLWKGSGIAMTANGGNCCEFSSTNRFEASGSIMSLLFGDNYANQTQLLATHCFVRLFVNCSYMVTAPSLPATTLTNYCYYHMFWGCTSLTTAPSLPATTLAANCYQNIFQGCTSLTTPPTLPATTLAANCYNGMFYGCTSLTTPPTLPATTLAAGCYNGMFEGTNVLPDCTNIDFTSSTVVASGGLAGLFAGTKITDSDLSRILPLDSNNKYTLPVTTLAASCYSRMFYGCTSLTTPPTLPATTLAASCYSRMFYGCTSLTTAPSLPATTFADTCYYMMHYGTNVLPDCSKINVRNNAVVASGVLQGLFAGTKVTSSDLASFLPLDSNNRRTLPVTTLTANCYDGMFWDCKNLTTAPSLPATKAADGCYNYMFYGCTSLTAMAPMSLTTLASNCCNGMYRGCTSLTRTQILQPTTLVSGCYNSMFYGCSNLATVYCAATYGISGSNTSNWLYGVKSTGNFYRKSGNWPTGPSGRPTNWTERAY